jgi:SlyX protein
MSGQDPQARLTNLETRLAYQDDTLDKLDAVIAVQAQRIARLETALERLAQRLDGLQRPAPAEVSDERPPHY